MDALFIDNYQPRYWTKVQYPGSSGVLKGGMIQLHGRRKALPDSEWHFHTQLPDSPEAEDKLSKSP